MKQKHNFARAHMTAWLGLVSLLALTIAQTGTQPVSAQVDSGAATTWYVATTGDDTNDCMTTTTPCASINGAIGKAVDGDVIEVAVGTYAASIGNEVVLINKSIILSGGWDVDFATQSDRSIIDGGAARRGITVNGPFAVFVDHFTIQNGFANNKDGGGIYNSGNLTLSDSIISNNVSYWMGGGIYNINGNLTINNSTINGNTAMLTGGSGGGGGGGIENYGGNNYLTLNNSTVSNNVLRGIFDGSGIQAGGTLTLNNSTISGNTGGHGDGIHTYTGTVILNNSTITNNQYSGITTGGLVTLQNTIIAKNGGLSDCSGGTFTSQGYNLIGNGAYCGLTPATGDIIGTSTSPIDPRLGPLQDNGGPTFTHALYGDSPAINAGNPGNPGSGGNACLATDQRGIIRPEGSACDIGSYESYITVKSINRANPDPTSSFSVDFTVTFTETVTGVDNTAPFSDFALTTTGVADAAIVAVNSSDNIYTVTVNTGSGNGTIRLDVVDDDSIISASGRPLGGVGSGNGNFTTGEVYSIIKIPTPISPAGTILITTPTYTWTAIPGATQYQFQLWKGPTLVYTQTVGVGACGTTTCSKKPTTTLRRGSYQWRVQAMLDGVWAEYTPDLTFAVTGPQDGFWNGSWMEYYVTPMRTQVQSFSIYVRVIGCGRYKITHTPNIAIVNGKFSFSGSFYAKGKFDTITTAHGTAGLNGFYLPGCGYLYGGPWMWSAVWQSGEQPASTTDDKGNYIILAMPGMDLRIDLPVVTPFDSIQQ